MIHKSDIENYNGSLQDLVEEIGNLKYDSLAEFLGLLSEKIRQDGDKDKNRGRLKLAKHLHDCANKLEESKVSINHAWRICEPYTK